MVSVEAPDRTGRHDDVLLGFDSVAEYVDAKGAFGGLLGRNANRIADGRFTVDGRTYELSRSEGDATLQGGKVGFDKVFWRVVRSDSSKLVLRFVSPDGDQGFPGELTVRATYYLKDHALCLELEAETTKATPVSLSAPTSISPDFRQAMYSPTKLRSRPMPFFPPMKGKYRPVKSVRLTRRCSISASR